MNSGEIIQKAKTVLLQEIEVEAIILFGSYARGTEKNTSDIDIAIKPVHNIDSTELIDIKNKLEAELCIDVHLIDLNAINEDFRYEILLSGKTLFCKNEYELEMYKLKMYSDYLLFSEDRKVIVDKIKKGGTLYGE